VTGVRWGAIALGLALVAPAAFAQSGAGPAGDSVAVEYFAPEGRLARFGLVPYADLRWRVDQVRDRPGASGDLGLGRITGRGGLAYAPAAGRFRAEAGAMVTMDDSIKIETKTGGGLGSVLKRSILGGESLFMNDMIATRDDSQVTFAPALPGDIMGLEVEAGKDLLVQSGSYMASSPEVNIDTKFGAGKTFFSGEGLFLLKLTGPGTVLLSSYGAIVQLDLAVGHHRQQAQIRLMGAA